MLTTRHIVTSSLIPFIASAAHSANYIDSFEFKRPDETKTKTKGCLIDKSYIGVSCVKENNTDNNSFIVLTKVLGNQFKSLDDGWDGFGGAAPSHKAIDAAIHFASKINLLGSCMPKATSAGDKTVSLYWKPKGKESYIEACFDEDDTYSFVIKHGSSYICEEDISIHNQIPTDLITSIGIPKKQSTTEPGSQYITGKINANSISSYTI